MNKKILCLISFTAGCAIGFLVTNRMLKERYEQMTQEDIASAKEAFLRELDRYKDTNPQMTSGRGATKDYKSKEPKTYQDRIKDLGYSKSPSTVTEDGPMLISPEVFGNEDGYDEIILTYYADGTLTDDSDRIMDESEIENTVGRESLDHFGDYEDDAVHIRNNRLKADYEILLDPRNYKEVLREKPYLR